MRVMRAGLLGVLARGLSGRKGGVLAGAVEFCRAIITGMRGGNRAQASGHGLYGQPAGQALRCFCRSRSATWPPSG